MAVRCLARRYAVLVPTLQLRYVAGGMLLMSLCNILLATALAAHPTEILLGYNTSTAAPNSTDGTGGDGDGSATYERITAGQSVGFILTRAICKDLVLHCLGLTLAYAAEAQHRANFERAKLFLEEEQAM